MTTPSGDQPHYGEQPPQDQPPQLPPPSYQQGYPQGYAPQGYGGQGYGGQAYPPGGYYAPQDHPKATTSMVLGIIGLVMCQVISPFAWSLGKKTVAEIDASQGRLGGRGQAQTGYILGIIGTVLLGLSLVFLVIYFIVIVAILGGSIASSST